MRVRGTHASEDMLLTLQKAKIRKSGGADTKTVAKMQRRTVRGIKLPRTVLLRNAKRQGNCLNVFPAFGCVFYEFA